MYLKEICVEDKIVSAIAFWNRYETIVDLAISGLRGKFCSQVGDGTFDFW